MDESDNRLRIQGFLCGCAITGLIWFSYNQFLADEWRSSGDGRTILNTRTGELRLTVNGRSVSEIQAQARKDANSKIFWKLKKVVQDYPNLNGSFEGEWGYATAPFRRNQLLTEREHEELMYFFEHAAENNPDVPTSVFDHATSELSTWQFN